MTETRAYYAMVITRCVVAGEVTDSIDISALMILAESEAEARAKIEAAEPCSYEYGDGESVEWPQARIVSIDECHGLEFGDEATEFVVQFGEIEELVQPGDEADRVTFEF